MVTDWGLVGGTVVAAMPIVIHPLLVLGIVAGINKIPLVACVFLGRSVKYLIMASCAVYSPHMLSYFGVSETTLHTATEAVREKASLVKETAKRAADIAKVNAARAKANVTAKAVEVGNGIRRRTSSLNDLLGLDSDADSCASASSDPG